MRLEIGGMNTRLRICEAVAALLALWNFGAAASAQKTPETSRPSTPTRITFEEQIAPLLEARCVKCHGEKLKKAGLDLRRRFTILAGGDSGPAIVPGKPENSLLVEMITSGQMPPEEEGRLDEKQIALLTEWVAQGAAIAGDKEEPLEPAAEEISLTEEDRQFWAFQPPQKPPVPRVKNTAQVRTPVDAYLLKRLEEVGGRFNDEAPRPVLIRRVYFDLLGLPPTPQEIAEFVNDPLPNAYERMVDRVLASPRYGERWGRHWLDLAGYADSDGYLAADRLRPEAWRYRDYVIRSFNEDKPFDRFVREQIAGDELADWRRAEKITPELADNLVATGFLRTALDPTYGTYMEPLECHKVMADTIQIISSSFLGLTVQCARCHAHKYDPISQKDYYRLHAILLSSYDPDRWIVSLERGIPLINEAEQKRVEQKNRAIAARVKQLNAEVTRLNDLYRRKFFDEIFADIDDAELRKQVEAALQVDKAKRNGMQQKLVSQYAADMELTEKAIGERFPAYAAELARVRKAIAAENALKESIVLLRGLKDLDAEPAEAHVLIRGDFNQPGQKVQPGIPDVLAPADYEFRPRPGYKTTGRRLALARWLVDPQNPLTARVQVNRIWGHHFGRGIVKTLDNFGTTGSRPTHPKLLDWLAVEFIERGWSRKRLHRLILNSAAYRQSSQPNPATKEIDPENVLLGWWPPQRHEGEVLRDSILRVAGKLSRRMYGSPVPAQRHADGLVSVADTPEGNRASVYIIVRRSQPVTFLELFDTPLMEINCPERTEAIVVTQSLSMMNSRFVESGAETLAARLLREVPADEAARLDLAFELLFGRAPRESERNMIQEFLATAVRTELAAKGESATAGDEQSARNAAWVQLSLVLLNSNEFLFVH